MRLAPASSLFRGRSPFASSGGFGGTRAALLRGDAASGGIRLLQVEKGQLGDSDDSRLADKLVTIGPEIGLAELRQAVSAKLIDTLGVSWDERYGQLVAYKNRFGDCNVPTRWSENQALARWVVSQRSAYRDSTLSEDRIRRLDELGFVWSTYHSAWEINFAVLVAYRNKYGDCDVSTRWPENPQLSFWVQNQRSDRQKGKVSEDRVRRLDELGFVWKVDDAAWEEMFAALVDYRDRFGDCNVPHKWQENRKLALWVSNQRAQRKTNRLKKDRIRRLDEISFVWGLRDAAWEEKFNALVEYKNRFGDCKVPSGWKENRKLALWVSTQRKARQGGEFSEDRIHRLDELGFLWNPFDAAWEEMFAVLVDYRHRFGDCNVPQQWPDNPQLGTWVSTQRKGGKLDNDQIRRLDELGFEWELRDAAREKMFAALAAYRDRFGDCNVPGGWPENPRLATWVGTRRKARKGGKLDNDQIRRLDELGFVWNPLDSAWEEMFSALVAYNDKFGNCMVPHDWAVNLKLGRWVGTQRNLQKANGLDEDRVRLLNELGFVWKPLDSAWEEMFATLVAYKDRFGHCKVPKRWSENRKLGLWVDTQRAVRKANNLDEDRIRRLDEIGFKWSRGGKRGKSGS